MSAALATTEPAAMDDSQLLFRAYHWIREPVHFEAAMTDYILTRILAHDHAIHRAHNKPSPWVFNASRPVDLTEFIQAIWKLIPTLQDADHYDEYSNVEVALFMILLLHRVSRYMCIQKHTLPRVLLGTCLLSAQFILDMPPSHDHYAKLVGLTRRDISDLSYTLLRLVDYQLFVSWEDWNKLAQRVGRRFDDLVMVSASDVVEV